MQYLDFTVRQWQPRDRQIAADLIGGVLAEYGLSWQPESADRDVLAVEEYYLDRGGDFWVIMQAGEIVGTAGYYPCDRAIGAVEIRKMYLLPQARGRGLGKYLLQQLELAIIDRGYTEIWIETASILKEAVLLYTHNSYLPASGIETPRCDLVYRKVLSSKS
jgi:putative acetyltransferase